jgi:hypothetical protein
MRRTAMNLGLSFLWVTLLTSCSSNVKGNVGLMPNYAIPQEEAAWIRNGEPILFEEEYWYPQDNYDVLLDSEVIPVGEYQGVQFFVGKIDVRPYDRLYSKFGKNKFRIFKKKTPDDQS